MIRSTKARFLGVGEAQRRHHRDAEVLRGVLLDHFPVADFDRNGAIGGEIAAALGNPPQETVLRLQQSGEARLAGA